MSREAAKDGRKCVADRVTAGLTYSTFVDVVSLGTQLLSLEPVVADTGSTERSGRLRALARANGTGTVVWGSYYQQGDSVYFLAHVTNTATGEELATIELVRGPVNAPLAALERLRDAVMTALATLTDPRLAQWMRYASKPPTFEAYAEFVEGVELHLNYEPEEAIPYFLRAAALDSNFTMALLWAVFAYADSGQGARADSILQALNGRRSRLVPLDRLLLDYHLASRRGDGHGALEAMRGFIEIAPGSEFLWKAGRAALELGRPGEAIEFLTQTDPESGLLRGRVAYWRVLTRAYHSLGDYEGELEALDRLRRLHSEAPLTLTVEMRTLAALGRIEELDARILVAVQRAPWGNPDWFRELRAHGYPAAASDLADRTLEWFEGRTSDWRGDQGQSFVYAKLLGHAGRWDDSQAVLEEILRTGGLFGPLRNNVLMQLAYVLASQGQRDEAFRVVGLSMFPNNLRVRAWVEAALGERERAMELLRETGYDPDMHGGFAELYWFESLRDYPPFVEEFMTPKA